VSDADRCVVSMDTAAAAVTAAGGLPAASDVNLSSIAYAGRPSRQLRRFDSLPGDVTGYDVTGHVILSSTRLVEKLTATLNALTVDCRQPSARNHGNGVETTSGRHDSSSDSSTSDATDADTGSATSNDEELELSDAVVKNLVITTDIYENVITSSRTEQHATTEVERLTELESPTPLSDPAVAESLTECVHSRLPTEWQQTDDRQCGGDDVTTTTTTTMDVILDKGPLGVGFCIDGGRDTPGGPAPITVKRLFKGSSNSSSSSSSSDNLSIFFQSASYRR